MNIRSVGIHSYIQQYISFVNSFESCSMTVSQQFPSPWLRRPSILRWLKQAW